MQSTDTKKVDPRSPQSQGGPGKGGFGKGRPATADKPQKLGAKAMRARAAANRATDADKAGKQAPAPAVVDAPEARDLSPEIDRLMSSIESTGSAELEQQLVRTRYEAFEYLKSAAAASPGLLVEPDESEPLPTYAGLPVADAEGLTGATVRKGILQGGCILVRNWLKPDAIASIRSGIDNSLDAMAEKPRDESNTWYQPYSPEQEWELNVQRRWAVECGAMLAADSPRVLFEVMQAYRDVGITRVVEEYLGERPAISMKKTVLRRVPVDIPADWHQDGAFMGDGLFSLNVWATLTDCGVDAPGLDMLTVRLDDLVETGTEGAHFDWSVAPGALLQAAGDTPITRPEFHAGDVVLFDEFCMHRSGTDAHMTDERYAVEMWCFAPSRYPGTQIPLVI